jgi:hypothetical protein
MKTVYKEQFFSFYKGALLKFELDDFQSHLTRQWNTDPEKKEFPPPFLTKILFF